MCPQASPDYGGLLGLIVTKINQILGYLPAPAQVKYAWKRQADAYLAQDNPAQNTWYTVLDTTDDVRVINFSGRVDTHDESVEGRITVDGNVIAVGPNAFTAASAYAVLNYWPSNAKYQWRPENDAQTVSYLLEGQSVKLEIRVTTGGGGTPLYSRVKWEQLLPT